MIIKYILKSEDLIAFHKKNLKDNSFLFKNYIFIIATLFAIVYCYYHPPRHNTVPIYSINAFMISFIINILVYVGIIYLVRYIYVDRIRSSILKNPSLIGEREIQVNEDWLELKTKNIKSEIPLSSIKQILSYKNYYFIYIDNQIAIIIPKTVKRLDELIQELSTKTNKNVC
jgi:hypothetical protein